MQCHSDPWQAANVRYPVDYNESMNTVLNQAAKPHKLSFFLLHSEASGVALPAAVHLRFSSSYEIGNSFYGHNWLVSWQEKVPLTPRSFYASTNSSSKFEALWSMCAKLWRVAWPNTPRRHSVSKCSVGVLVCLLVARLCLSLWQFPKFSWSYSWTFSVKGPLRAFRLVPGCCPSVYCNLDLSKSGQKDTETYRNHPLEVASASLSTSTPRRQLESDSIVVVWMYAANTFFASCQLAWLLAEGKLHREDW